MDAEQSPVVDPDLAGFKPCPPAQRLEFLDGELVGPLRVDDFAGGEMELAAGEGRLDEILAPDRIDEVRRIVAAPVASRQGVAEIDLKTLEGRE
jgi:hypothetical protein